MHKEPQQFNKQTIISKRRFANGKKEYMITNNNSKQFVWNKLSRSIVRQAKEYDEAHKDILPYFPSCFEDCNKKVRIYSKDKSLKIEYNGKPVTVESDLTKKARLEILTELDKIFPVQVYEAMYHQGREIKKVNNMVREIIEEEVQQEEE